MTAAPRRIVTVLVVLLAWSASGSVLADEWVGATVTEVFSSSREWFVRVTPGRSVGDLVGFAGAAKGPYARAEFYRRAEDRSYRLVAEPTLRNPVAPVEFVVTDRGYLVTFDNWHNMGYGIVVAGHSPQGRALFAYELKDLFSAEEIAAFAHSVSSIWWRKGRIYVREGQRSVYVTMDDKGTELIVDAETGAWQQCAHRGPQHLCRDRNADRQWRAFREPGAKP